MNRKKLMIVDFHMKGSTVTMGSATVAVTPVQAFFLLFLAAQRSRNVEGVRAKRATP